VSAKNRNINRPLRDVQSSPPERLVPLLRKPITGIAGCCARAARDQATAAPPGSDMNSRRFIRTMILPPPATIFRRLNLLQIGHPGAA
jgi:hypothetical protein